MNIDEHRDKDVTLNLGRDELAGLSASSHLGSERAIRPGPQDGSQIRSGCVELPWCPWLRLFLTIPS